MAQQDLHRHPEDAHSAKCLLREAQPEEKAHSTRRNVFFQVWWHWCKIQNEFPLHFLSQNTPSASSILSHLKASLRWDIHLFCLLSTQASLPRHGCINVLKCKKVQDADALLACNTGFFSEKQHKIVGQSFSRLTAVCLQYYRKDV